MKKHLFALWHRLNGRHICWEPGCLKVGMKCHLVDYDSAPPRNIFDWYCPEHATKAGYCWMCGEFWAGCESFDFDKSHLCPNCQSEVEAEDDLDEDEPWFNDYSLEEAEFKKQD